MKPLYQRIKLAYDECMADDRSIEYTIQYIMDTCRISHNLTMKALHKISVNEKAIKPPG